MNNELVRPSSLPKLQECRMFEGAPGTSEAAARGTKLDSIIRSVWAGGEDPALPEDEVDAVQFALSTLKLLSGGLAVETREEELQAAVPVPGVKPGTMDALCIEGGWLADFKTGQIRSYHAQMAAYALACMDAYFADEWATHLIFVDQKQVNSHTFTREEAEQLVTGIVNAPKVETPCDYCSWCGKFESCPAVMRAGAELTKDELPACSPAAKGKGELPATMAHMLTDHAAAHDFMTKLKIVNDWADILKKNLLDQLSEESAASDYFSRVVVSGSKKVNPLSLAKYGMELGFDRLLRICSQIPLSKVEEVWHEVFGETPVPEEIIVTSGGSVSLRTKKIKKNLTNK
jgi:roadblock/LC7 domain-containing protein